MSATAIHLNEHRMVEHDVLDYEIRLSDLSQRYVRIDKSITAIDAFNEAMRFLSSHLKAGHPCPLCEVLISPWTVERTFRGTICTMKPTALAHFFFDNPDDAVWFKLKYV
jgi:hypothetical protein